MSFARVDYEAVDFRIAGSKAIHRGIHCLAGEMNKRPFCGRVLMVLGMSELSTTSVFGSFRTWRNDGSLNFYAIGKIKIVELVTILSKQIAGGEKNDGG